MSGPWCETVQCPFQHPSDHTLSREWVEWVFATAAADIVIRDGLPTDVGTIPGAWLLRVAEQSWSLAGWACHKPSKTVSAGLLAAIRKDGYAAADAKRIAKAIEDSFSHLRELNAVYSPTEEVVMCRRWHDEHRVDGSKCIDPYFPFEQEYAWCDTGEFRAVRGEPEPARWAELTHKERVEFRRNMRIYPWRSDDLAERIISNRGRR